MWSDHPARTYASFSEFKYLKGVALDRNATGVSSSDDVCIVRPAERARPISEVPKPLISSRDRNTHLSDPMNLVGILTALGRAQMRTYDVEYCVHAANLHCEKADGARGKPRLARIVVGLAELRRIVDGNTVKSYCVTAGSRHAERLPPGPINR